MCEFWSVGMGFDSSFSCLEAASVAHTMGRPIVSAEAFTANSGERWRQYPGSMKNQGDWAFCIGVNRFVYHTFAHKPLGDAFRPGMTMGPYGVHWDRGQTWWPLVRDYHRYVARCSHLLRQGVTVSDILYLTPEGAPHVFRPPASALQGHGPLADKKGYGFDGCSPNILTARAGVKDGRIVFPGGTSYRVLVLPRCETMTPRLLTTITHLVDAGAVVFGAPPVTSPSLSGYPDCDAEVRRLARVLWGETPAPVKPFGKGRLILDAIDQAGPGPEEKSLLPAAGHWIWFDEGNPAHHAAAGEVRFRYRWKIPAVKNLQRAEIEASADNSFVLEVNGRRMLRGDDFNRIASADITAALRPGKNAIVAVATNAASETRNPAGFIAAMRLRFADGSKTVIASGREWDASRDGVTWSAAKPLGPGTIAPWNLKPSPDAARPAARGLYPDYATVADVLADMGIPEDFRSDGPVRHAHRETAREDIYFIANTSDGYVQATCSFRAKAGAPQLWDPLTAEIRPLPQVTHRAGITSVPVTFEAHQSFFVVFPREGRPGDASDAAGVNFPPIAPVMTLEGAWTVSFQPARGGPEQITFEALQDWTRRDERGIRYYSGIATYRKRFDLSRKADGRSYLDLGTVHDMARVRLNGEDLGVVWCAPWRVEITGIVKARANVLEIDVANRWSNRLLGDQQAPDKNARTVKWESGLLAGKSFKTGRYTFATHGGPNKLLPSGLIGPVTIQAAK
jgi:hypothetical protein